MIDFQLGVTQLGAYDESKLLEFVPFDREFGGSILTISELKYFYFLPHFHDMRCSYSRVYEIKRRRNKPEITEIAGSIWMELIRLLNGSLSEGYFISK